jgi:gluconolactonase
MGGKCDRTSDLLGGARRHDEGLKAAPERPPRVCRMDAKTRRAAIVMDAFEKPKGLAFSPDEKTLYIIDADLSHGGKTSVYAV